MNKTESRSLFLKSILYGVGYMTLGAAIRWLYWDLDMVILVFGGFMISIGLVGLVQMEYFRVDGHDH